MELICYIPYYVIGNELEVDNWQVERQVIVDLTMTQMRMFWYSRNPKVLDDYNGFD